MWNLYFFQRCCQKNNALFLLLFYSKLAQSSSGQRNKVCWRLLAFSSVEARNSSAPTAHFSLSILHSPTPTIHLFIRHWPAFFSNRIQDFLTKLSLFVAVLQTQRRVTFHLPDGSQESCSDSGLGDPEPSSTASTSQPLPLSFPQEEYYEQTSPNSRTEGDGNSDPESSEFQFQLFFFSFFWQQASVVICIFLGGI